MTFVQGSVETSIRKMEKDLTWLYTEVCNSFSILSVTDEQPCQRRWARRGLWNHQVKREILITGFIFAHFKVITSS